MASHMIPPAAIEIPEKPLSREEGWDLIFGLFGTAKEAYAAVGGSDAWMRSERAAWDQKDLSV